ncbi:hypothetical protein B296_00021184 [Ensete ventricosum]|uniref:Uncharacterized protein n=1 Tax=Ensete ventricosum TaxID=4639 RepID=A0A426ZS62_ENSVE|nr:hypothetical protein B296_00021184 [Ensete ventricosum]
MSVSEARRGYREFAMMVQLQPDDGPRYNLDIRPSSDDAVGSRRKFARRFTEGIGKLVGNAKGDRREEDRRTYRKIAGGCRSMRELGLN